MYFALIGYKDIAGERGTVKLTNLTNVKACPAASCQLPRSGTEFFQLANEMFADRPSLESDVLAGHPIAVRASHSREITDLLDVARLRPIPSQPQQFVNAGLRPGLFIYALDDHCAVEPRPR